MSERKLATIQRISNLEPIPDADKILKATVLGWEVVVLKDEFKIGSLCVYCEIDSILPDKPEFEFLRTRKFRIRTIRLKGQISQGICFPLSILPKGKYKEGDDVTTIMGVTKYDPQAEIERRLLEESRKISSNRIFKFFKRYKWYRVLFIKRNKRGGFPTFIPKTDEDRIQLFPNICEKEKDTLFSITEKLDGQSGTWFLIKKKSLFSRYIFGVCSRNIHLARPDKSSYWNIAIKYDVKNLLKSIIGLNKFIALQGEILGPGIQKNKYGLKEYEIYLFNIITPNNKLNPFNLDPSILQKIVDRGLKLVPHISEGAHLKKDIPSMVEFAKGKSILADIHREGIVVRNYKKGISFKVVNPDFLLKYEE